MNLLIDIVHPAHVHLFRNVRQELIKGGHRVIVTVRDIPAAIRLLDHYGIEYIRFGEKKTSFIGKGFSILKYGWNILSIVKDNNITLSLSTSIEPAHVSCLTRLDAILFDDDDDEVESMYVNIAHPFGKAIFTPDPVSRKSTHAIRYPGTHELAYLHPKRFKPDQEILKECGLSPGETFFVLRFNEHKAYHDVGEQGLTIQQKKSLIEFLLPKGKVFVSEEKEVVKEFPLHQTPVEPSKMHSLLSFTTLFIGDSQTMTSEAAILGTPALKCNTYAGRLSVPNELEAKYGLCYSFLPSEFENLMSKARELLSIPDIKSQWEVKRKRFLDDKIDVTAMMLWFVENYPESIQKMKQGRDLFNSFK
ncbi:MAG: DUF354 domain-containing protein [Bacteroidetes bacterium]|nr:DUF354 domain-containing protein [Bacteroidota bacterium]